MNVSESAPFALLVVSVLRGNIADGVDIIVQGFTDDNSSATTATGKE